MLNDNWFFAAVRRRCLSGGDAVRMLGFCSNGEEDPPMLAIMHCCWGEVDWWGRCRVGATLSSGEDGAQVSKRGLGVMHGLR